MAILKSAGSEILKFVDAKSVEVFSDETEQERRDPENGSSPSVQMFLN